MAGAKTIYKVEFYYGCEQGYGPFIFVKTDDGAKVSIMARARRIERGSTIEIEHVLVGKGVNEDWKTASKAIKIEV